MAVMSVLRQLNFFNLSGGFSSMKLAVPELPTLKQTVPHLHLYPLPVRRFYSPVMVPFFGVLLDESSPSLSLKHTTVYPLYFSSSRSYLGRDETRVGYYSTRSITTLRKILK